MNLAAPIIPGTSAAGVSIGDEILPIIREHTPDRIQQTMTGDVFHFDNLKLWSTPDRITVNQIAVFGVYTGATKEGLAINLPISEVAVRIGEVCIGEYDELCIDGYPGIGLILGDRLIICNSSLPKCVRKINVHENFSKTP